MHCNLSLSHQPKLKRYPELFHRKLITSCTNGLLGVRFWGGEPFTQKFPQVAQIFTKQLKRDVGHMMQ